MAGEQPRAYTRCVQCGQTDDHPKVHGPSVDADGVPLTKHHDCLGADEVALVTASGQEAGSGPKASAVIAACVGGARGDELLALIQGGGLPQAEGLAHAAATEAEEGSK